MGGFFVELSNIFNKLMENPREINCKEIFRKAYENKYTWKNEFNGYKGKCIFDINKNIHEGEFILGETLNQIFKK